jgi:hypothetical protein
MARIHRILITTLIPQQTPHTWMFTSLHSSSTIVFNQGSQIVMVLQVRPHQLIKRQCLKILVQAWKLPRKASVSRSITQIICLSVRQVLIPLVDSEKDLQLEQISKEFKTMEQTLSNYKIIPMRKCPNQVKTLCIQKSLRHKFEMERI